jgi:hypothetical protein
MNNKNAFEWRGWRAQESEKEGEELEEEGEMELLGSVAEDEGAGAKTGGTKPARATTMMRRYRLACIQRLYSGTE